MRKKHDGCVMQAALHCTALATRPQGSTSCVVVATSQCVPFVLHVRECALLSSRVRFSSAVAAAAAAVAVAVAYGANRAWHFFLQARARHRGVRVGAVQPS